MKQSYEENCNKKVLKIYKQYQTYFHLNEIDRQMQIERRRTMNCPDDDAWKRFVQKHPAEYARIFFEEYEKHKKKG